MNLGMPSLKEFVDAMGTSWPVTAAIFFATSATLFLQRAGVDPFTELPGSLVLLFYVMAIFAGFAFLMSLAQGAINLIKAAYQQHQLKKVHLAKIAATKALEQKKIAELSDLPEYEHAIMAYLFSARRQYFNASLGHPNTVALLQRGMIARGAPPYTEMDCPHFIPDYIWAAMASNPEGFTTDVTRVRYPFGHPYGL